MLQGPGVLQHTTRTTKSVPTISCGFASDPIPTEQIIYETGCSVN
jgi:hypothetical protein